MNAPRRKRNSSRTNLIISAGFHVVIIGALVFFAAREGLLGKQLKKIAVVMVPKEKPPEKPKEPAKPPEPPKEEPPKTEPPKVVAAPKIEAPKSVRTEAPPPSLAPAAAPPPTAVPAIDFSDGAKAVQSTSDAVGLYKNFVEFSIRSKWVRPDDIYDASYVAEVEVGIDPNGNISGGQWKKLSGDQRWDESVKRALAQTTKVFRTPPKNFPGKFIVRFDVTMENATSAIEEALR
jgi:outer membrane biosynthesis protein TonB